MTVKVDDPVTHLGGSHAVAALAIKASGETELFFANSITPEDAPTLAHISCLLNVELIKIFRDKNGRCKCWYKNKCFPCQPGGPFGIEGTVAVPVLNAEARAGLGGNETVAAITFSHNGDALFVAEELKDYVQEDVAPNNTECLVDVQLIKTFLDRVGVRCCWYGNKCFPC